MDTEDWRKRISSRMDLVARLTHLTRGIDDDNAFDKLWKILVDRRLLGSKREGYIIGGDSAVCFQEVPLYSIAENLLFEEDNKRYSWFGVRFNKLQLYNRGARPVIYGDKNELKSLLPVSEYWRIVSLNLNNIESMVDWSHEREWRLKGDLIFEYSEIEIIVKDDEYFQLFVERCFEEKREDILKNVHGIVPLNTVIS